jgi:hypothetical protein
MTDREDMTPKHENGKQPDIERQLFEAVEKDAPSKVNKLVSSRRVSPNCRNEKGQTPLIVASITGSAACAAVLLRHGAEVDSVGADGQTALITAAGLGHLEVVKVLVAKGSDLEIKNSDGLTALNMAQAMRHDAVKDFLEAQPTGSTGHFKMETSTDLDDDGSAANRPVVEAQGVTDDHLSGDTQDEADDGEDQEIVLGAPSLDVAEDPGHEPQWKDLRPEGPKVAPSGESSGGGGEAFMQMPWMQDDLPFTEANRDNAAEMSPREKAEMYKSIIGASLEKGFNHVGTHLLIYDFDNDIRQVFSKRPNKGKRSLSAIAQHMDGFMTRQQLADCVRGAAFTREAATAGLDISSLSFSLKIALARLKESEQRLSLAKDAQENRYTVQQVREKVRELTTGVASEDRALGQMAMRRVGDILRLSTDKEMRGFLRNKNRLKSALKRSDLLRMLDHTEDARKHIHESVKLLEDLEQTLVEITVPNRLTGRSDAGDDTGGDEDPL